MKNFTNNFKQFTSRLSARWLIMALMLLLGTSSLWAAAATLSGDQFIIIEFDGSNITSNNTGWNGTVLYMWYSDNTNETKDYNGAITLAAGDKIPSGIQFRTKHDYGGNRGKTADIHHCATSEALKSGYKYTVKLDGTNDYKNSGDNTYNRLFSHTLNCEVVDVDWCEDVFTVAGSSSLCNGKNWAPTETINDMQCNDGIYSITYTSVAVGSYEFKVCKNHGWGEAYPSSNYQLSVEDEAKNVTIIFNVKTKEITVEQTKACTTVEKPTISITNPTKCGDGPVTAGKVTITNHNPTKYNYILKKDGTVKDIVYSDGYAITEAGSYTVTADLISGTSCGAVTSDSQTASIEDKIPSIGDFVITGDTEICSGTSTNLECTDVNGDTYLWNTGATTRSINTGNLTKDTNYSVTVTKLNGTCPATKTANITITVNALPSAPGLKTASSITVCPGNLTLANYVNVTAGTTVKWYSNEDCTNEATSPSITAGESKDFYAKAVNSTTGCVSSGKTKLSITAYSAPNDFTLTAIPAEICSGADVVISIGNKQDGVTYKLGNETISESITVNPTDDTEYTVTASLNACPALTKSISTEIITVHPIPSFTVDPTNLSLCKGSTSETDLTELSHVGVANGDPVWYDAETAGNVVTTGADLVNGGTYWVAAENNETGCFNPERKQFVLTINNLPNTPILGNESASLCQSNETADLNTLADISDVVWYKDANEVNNELSLATAGTTTYTAKAVDANGCQSATGVEFELTVNPLPTITSISASNDEPVPFEDVVLTATGVTSGAEVRWYLGNDVTPVATGTTYIVTSETAGDVIIVKAKAFLNGCESAVETKTVTFGEETCEPTTITVPANYIEIYCKYNDAPAQHDMKVDIWKKSEGQGTESYQPCSKSVDGYAYWKFNITDDAEYCIKISNNENNYKSGSMCSLTKGHKYYFDIPGGWSGWVNGPDESKTQDITETQDGPPAITAPAVKTVSVYSEQGSGVVNFVGRVIKTGCAAGTNIWVGYQYKEIGDVWPTTGVTAGTGVKELIPIGNNLVDFSTDIEGLENGNYHFRAYVINGYGRSADPNDYDQGVYYGIDIPVTVSLDKDPVEDPVLQWINEEGYPYPGGAYCPDATAYVKLTYGGSKPETVVWSNSISDSNPVLVKETLHENWYSLTVEKSGDLSVSLANEENTGAVQADAISLTMTSRISFPTTEVIDGKTTICSNDANGTELKITNAVVGYQYALYKVTNEAAGTSTKVEGPITATDSNKDNLTFTIQGAEAAGKYFVQVEETVCDQTAVSQGYTTIEVIDAGAITLTLEPSEVTVNPWLPAVLTVSITEGYDYTIDIPAPLVYTANGNVYTIKAPEPADTNYPDISQQDQKQYGKVTFDSQEYTVTADLKTDTGSSCITPQTSTITLTPYVEDCVIEHENQ